MSTLPEKILLATDGSEDAALASRAASDLAVRFGSQLHVVHAWHSVPSPHFKSFIHAQFHQSAEELLAKQVASIESAGGDVAKSHLEEGPTVDVILSSAEKMGAGLIVLGSRGHGPVSRIVMGSVSEGVTRHSHCPVLMMRGDEGAWPPERVVFGDDGSEEARKAGELAATIGEFYGAKGLLVEAYPSLMEVDVDGGEITARMLEDEDWIKTRERELGAWAEEIEGSLRSRPKVRISSGDPTVCLLSAAEEGGVPENALIAVGSRGLGMVQRTRLGSVSTKVLHVARGPILVCPRALS